MEKYKEELMVSLKVIESTISNCEKMQLKFAEGTSQHTLLKNRIKALYISRILISKEEGIEQFSKDELISALPPVVSIISKSEKAQLKFIEGTGHYTRLNNLIKAMQDAKILIEGEILRRN